MLSPSLRDQLVKTGLLSQNKVEDYEKQQAVLEQAKWVEQHGGHKTSGYIVVRRTIANCASTGAITWTSYDSKEQYDEGNNGKMRSWYEPVACGVTSKEAIKLCSSPEAIFAAILYEIRKASEELQPI